MKGMVIALLAAGEMGSKLGQRLQRFGATVRTSLHGRSSSTGERARRAGFAIVETDDELVAGADFVLSIVPPGQAEAVAERLRVPLLRTRPKPVFVECNAISPQSVGRIAQILAPTGAGFVDAAIMGARGAGDAGPAVYACGPEVGHFERLAEYGLRVRRLDGAIGRASAMKMVYSGITKGFTAMASTVILGASRYGLAEELRDQLAETHPALGKWIGGYISPMYVKADRFVAEMEQIADFLGEDSGGSEIYLGVASVYKELAGVYSARTGDGEGDDIDVLYGFAKSSS
jgi:L-threonate 2-dehydrogenase